MHTSWSERLEQKNCHLRTGRDKDKTYRRTTSGQDRKGH